MFYKPVVEAIKINCPSVLEGMANVLLDDALRSVLR